MITKMKNVFYGLGVAILSLPVAASAQWNKANLGDSNLAETPVSQVIISLMQWLLYILGFIAIIAFVISGILYLTAAGDETKAEKAKNAMLYAIIGVIVALIGLIAINAIGQWLGDQSNTF